MQGCSRRPLSHIGLSALPRTGRSHRRRGARPRSWGRDLFCGPGRAGRPGAAQGGQRSHAARADLPGRGGRPGAPACPRLALFAYLRVPGGLACAAWSCAATRGVFPTARAFPGMAAPCWADPGRAEALARVVGEHDFGAFARRWRADQARWAVDPTGHRAHDRPRRSCRWHPHAPLAAFVLEAPGFLRGDGSKRGGCRRLGWRWSHASRSRYRPWLASLRDRLSAVRARTGMGTDAGARDLRRSALRLASSEAG